jgi:hypothetical protein
MTENEVMTTVTERLMEEGRAFITFKETGMNLPELATVIDRFTTEAGTYWTSYNVYAERTVNGFVLFEEN